MGSSLPRDGTPRGYGGMLRRARAVAVALAVLAWPGAPLHAQGNERWLLLPAFAGDKTKDLDVQAMTGALEAELLGAGQKVLPNANAAGLFESQHSSEPVQLGNEQLRRLSKSVGQAARHLALGELPDAQREMEGVNALSGPARDYLNREARRARKIFDNCLMAAYLWERSAQHQPALRQMIECSRSFPGFKPEGRAYPPQVKRLFDEAMRQLSQREPSSLRVLSIGRDGCGVRLNGMEVGKSPLEMSEVRAGATRVQLECEPGVAGRIHNVELEPGKNEVSIDPVFDAAVHTQAGLWLAYANEREREKRAPIDAQIIGRTVGATRVVMLWNSPGALGHDIAVRPAGVGAGGELARASFAADTGYARGGASKLASALVGWLQSQPGPHATKPAAGPINDRALSSAAARSRPPPPANAPAPSSSPQPRTAVPQPSAASPPPARPYTQQHATAGAILAIVGGASAAVSWGVYAARQPKRTVVGGTRDETSYRKLGVVALSTAGVGTTLISLSEYFWLPDDPSIPPFAWVVGAFGLSVGVAALTLSLTEADCKLGDDRVSCQSFYTDHFFGPMLFMHALPFMTAPLWYGLRMAFRPAGVQVAVNTGFEGLPSLQLRGEF